MALNSRALSEIGGFDEAFFLYREETDLCRRARDAGYLVRHIASAVAIHVGDASSSSTTLLVGVRPQAIESHYRFIRKHYGRSRAAACWIVGLAGSCAWVIVGRRKDQGWASLRGHLRLVLALWPKSRSPRL
jgi:GT2 family glycosyltransferase